MARKKKIVSEDDVKKKIIKPWLNATHAWFFMHVPRGMGIAGVPDYIACMPVVITPEMVGKKVGLFVAPEAKSPSKKSNVSPSQALQMRLIDEAGGITGVISSQADCERMHNYIADLVFLKK